MMEFDIHTVMRLIKEACPHCAAGVARVDIHSRVAMNYHGYEYNPCKLSFEAQEYVRRYEAEQYLTAIGRRP